MNGSDWQKYIVAFVITGLIFFTALYVSNLFSERRVAEVRSIQDKISLDILSSETQFDLLKEVPCRDVSDSVLSQEINSLAGRLTLLEQERAQDDAELVFLKKYYSLLQIKDYLLAKRVSEQCGLKPLTILYFYSNRGDCADCERMGYVLTYLREQYPELRVYAFDYDLDLSTVQTLANLFKVERRLPAVVINDSVTYGFQSVENFDKLLPELAKLREEKTKQVTTTTTE